jgi:hypothetical protein
MQVLQGAFADFTTWNRIDLGADAGGDGLGNVGDRVVYLNQLPPHGSTEFPVGTIIVKTAGWGTPDAGPTFAMAKVGGCYNMDGAKDWEWFELSVPPSGKPGIVWAGVKAPAGDNYFGQAPTSCNTCHASAASNDFVPSYQLSLTTF